VNLRLRANTAQSTERRRANEKPSPWIAIRFLSENLGLSSCDPDFSKAAQATAGWDIVLSVGRFKPDRLSDKQYPSATSAMAQRGIGDIARLLPGI
jgi:hypothetical protein